MAIVAVVHVVPSLKGRQKRRENKTTKLRVIANILSSLQKLPKSLQGASDAQTT